MSGVVVYKPRREFSAKYKIGSVVIFIGEGKDQQEPAPKVVVIAGVMLHERAYPTYTYRMPHEKMPANIWNSIDEARFLTPEEWRAWQLKKLEAQREQIDRKAMGLAHDVEYIKGELEGTNNGY